MQQHKPPTTRHAEARAFLAEYVPPDVAGRAFERIAAHDETLDESYKWASVTDLVRELSEEPLDTIAWASLVSVRVEDTRGQQLLGAIAHHGAKADQLVGELRRLLARKHAA